MAFAASYLKMCNWWTLKLWPIFYRKRPKRSILRAARTSESGSVGIQFCHMTCEPVGRSYRYPVSAKNGYNEKQNDVQLIRVVSKNVRGNENSHANNRQNFSGNQRRNQNVSDNDFQKNGDKGIRTNGRGMALMPIAATMTATQTTGHHLLTIKKQRFHQKRTR